MLNQLKKKNPELVIHSVYDDAFKGYGQIVNDLDVAQMLQVGENTEMPKDGSAYCASFDSFEALPIAQEISAKCFGYAPCQIGYCYGHNQLLNALEWHICNEINIAVTDAVLILAKRSDIDADGTLHSSKCKIFYVPKGTAIDVYSDTLHYCPCQVTKDGFGMVVGLTKGTNLPLEDGQANGTLWANNKWLLAHYENSELLESGAKCGIYGKNIEIKF